MIPRSYLLIIAALFLIGCGSDSDGPSEGNHRPEARLFTLQALNGDEYSVNAARGKVLLLDFWATWCPPCEKAIPELISLYDTYKDDEFILWGIGLDNPDALRSFSEKYRIPYPILVGTRETGTAYGIRSIPTVYLIDKSGRVVSRIEGYRPGLARHLGEKIDQLLKE